MTTLINARTFCCYNCKQNFFLSLTLQRAVLRSALGGFHVSKTLGAIKALSQHRGHTTRRIERANEEKTGIPSLPHVKQRVFVVALDNSRCLNQQARYRLGESVRAELTV